MKRTASYSLDVDGWTVNVQRKPVKYLRLRVRAPEGSLHVSAPLRVSDRDLRAFVQSKRGWIEAQHARCQAQARPAHEFEQGSAVPLWGDVRRLHFGKAMQTASEEVIVLPGRAQRDREARRRALHSLYRVEMEQAIAQRLSHWQSRVGAQAQDWWVRDMRTRWGSCSIARRRICLSLRLVAHPPACLDYVLVHELAHLIEPRHDRAFWTLVGQAMPNWRAAHDHLRAARHDDGLWR